ncbi:MAG: hypothetical protein ABSC57_01370 [Syntrophales bacterium]
MKKLGLLCVLLVAVLPATCGLPDSNQTWRVQYKVTGSARNADITISIPGGGTEQRPVAIPYASQTYTFKGMDHAYISAQNKSEYGDVTTEIIVNGSTLKKASSQGAYTIASVSWLVKNKD